MLTQSIFEFLGTMILVLLGDGVCAACTLNKSKAQGAGWVVITLAWGFAVMCGVFVAGPVSGAHLNPAVTLGLALAGLFPWAGVLPYIVAQMLGGFAGAVLVYAFYVDHFAATSDNPDGMLGCFCTMPAIEHKTVNFFSEFLATFVLVFVIMAIGKAGFFTADYVDPERGQIVIDVGMNTDEEGKLCGDVDFASCEKVASWITPVPGGAGPMTIAMLMKNTIHCFLGRMQGR